MKLFRFVLAFLLLVAAQARGHVGSPTVFFQGQAGPYSTRVIIKPAEVIPGLADISVRVEGAAVERVTALPMKWNVGREGAPPPDVAKPVPGETNLFSAQLWFMEPGAHAVEIGIEGKAGSSRVTIPVDAAAIRVLPMPESLRVLLGGLGVLIVALLVTIVGASFRESALPPGIEPTLRRRRWTGVVMTASAIFVVGLLWGGMHWWQAEAADYRNNRLYRPMDAEASVTARDGERVLHLEVPRFKGAAPLVPDHGKLMHLFLMREPELDAFAHLHPLKRDKRNFEATLPNLPPGTYRIYADVTYETGWSDTLTAKVELPEAAHHIAATAAADPTDPDDSWSTGSPSPDSSTHDYELAPNCFMRASFPPGIKVNQPIELRFTVRDRDGRALLIEPYLGMRGHLVLTRTDGAVFTHLHPGGSASMAAMQLSVLRAEGKLPLRAAFGSDDPLCKLPAAGSADQSWLRGNEREDGATVSFPYAFPKSGVYRLWAQIRSGGVVRTAVCETTVSH